VAGYRSSRGGRERVAERVRKYREADSRNQTRLHGIRDLFLQPYGGNRNMHERYLANVIGWIMRTHEPKEQVEILYIAYQDLKSQTGAKHLLEPLWTALKKHNHPSTRTAPQDFVVGFHKKIGEWVVAGMVDVTGYDGVKINDYSIMYNFMTLNGVNNDDFDDEDELIKLLLLDWKEIYS